MKSTRYLVKYNRHTGQYGIHDRASSATRWQMDKAEAASQAARMNAVYGLIYDLNTTINHIGIVLTGAMTAERRARFKAMRETLRDLRDDIPSCDDLTHELNREWADQVPHPATKES